MQLHEREREILKMFFGIGCQEMTLEEIGPNSTLPANVYVRLRKKQSAG